MIISHTLAALIALAGLPLPKATVPNPVVGITGVTWALSNPGGVGTFRVTIANTGGVALQPNAVWAQAVSAGATTIQGGFPGAKAGTSSSINLSPTSSGRCYVISLVIEPDSATQGISITPKAASTKVCLDPDGKGIVP